ncbi:hypothetical protein ACJRO7_025405 [Eucalyptus globulus]|uniref:catalase n=1 Tax=Eucalyptus globulus TaxID=34317 RepID=A0ABD3KHE6_EUCGL
MEGLSYKPSCWRIVKGSPSTVGEEDNLSLVGNNSLVFFIRDGMKFPDMALALKTNPESHVQENRRILDVLSHHPDSLGILTFLFDDIGIPQDYRHTEGSGVNTYALINKAGKAHYVKFHWKRTCGVKSLLEEEAIRVGGSKHSLATQDLYDSIAAGNYLEWKLFTYCPVMPVGRLVLNKNIDNFFAENEQLAFCPSIVVPGRDRLAPNYLQLPSNAPKCAHHNSHHEGFMSCHAQDEEINYFSSRYDPVHHTIEKENNFKQPGERYQSRAPDRYSSQEWFICQWIDALSESRVTHEIHSIWISYRSEIAKRLNVTYVQSLL